MLELTVLNMNSVRYNYHTTQLNVHLSAPTNLKNYVTHNHVLNREIRIIDGIKLLSEQTVTVITINIHI